MAARIRPVLLFLPALLALSACKQEVENDAGEAVPAAAAQAVGAAPVMRREMASVVTVSGPVAAVEEMQLGVELSGLRVTGLQVDVGQAVSRGQVLLTLDHRTLESDLAQAAAAMREAEAGAALARANLARGESLAKDKYISAMQLDELRANRAASEARLGTARAARDAAALRRSFADLRAPASGVISRRMVQPGQVVGAGQTLLQLIRDGRLEWRAELAPEPLSRVKPGDRIELKTADGRSVDGRVRAVSPGVDAQTRTGTVYADLPDPQGLQPGTFLQGRIAIGVGQVTAVPGAAVVLRDGFPTVFVIEGGNKVRAARITQGSRDARHVQVLEGVKPGDQVVTDGAGFLADGDSVRVIPGNGMAGAAKTP